MNKKRVMFGKILVCVGSILIFSGLALLFYNVEQQRHAQTTSNQMLAALQEKMQQVQEGPHPSNEPGQLIQVNGVTYLGVLELPTLNLTLPVQADWSYEKLRKSPCVYAGSLQEGNLVLLGHNYRSHFGPIDQLRPGDELTLTDGAGNVFFFIVDELLVLDDGNVEEMIDGEYDLSLFTCNYDGTARVTVRCTLQNKTDRYPVLQRDALSFLEERF